MGETAMLGAAKDSNARPRKAAKQIRNSRRVENQDEPTDLPKSTPTAEPELSWAYDTRLFERKRRDPRRRTAKS
jgi:hypothetical protein